MKYARIINGTAIDVRTESPKGCFAPIIEAQFIEVPDEVETGWIFDDKSWTPPPAPVAEITKETAKIPKLSPVQFKLCFTAAERIAIKAFKATDPVIADYYEILDDLRLKEVDLNLQSNKDGVAYLVGKGLLTEERATEILQGVIK